MSTPLQPRQSNARSERVATLRGGPCDGLRLTVNDGASLLIEGSQEDGRVARYRPSREKGIYTFRGFDEVVVRLTLPDENEAI